MMCIQEVADSRLRIRCRLTCPHMHALAIKRKEHLWPKVPITGCGHLMRHAPGMIRRWAHWQGFPGSPPPRRRAPEGQWIGGQPDLVAYSPRPYTLIPSYGCIAEHDGEQGGCFAH